MAGGGEAPSKASVGRLAARAPGLSGKCLRLKALRGRPRAPTKVQSRGSPPAWPPRKESSLVFSGAEVPSVLTDSASGQAPAARGTPAVPLGRDAAGGFCLALLARKRTSCFVSSHLAPSTGSRARTRDAESRPPALPSGSPPPAPRPHATAQLR